jgi:inosine-uridine nucleoside N-ribohydrolase
MGNRPKIILDCDPGLDDAVAIVVAAEHADLLAITTVGGNAPLIDVTNNALMTCQLFSIDVPVHSGAVRPLLAEPRHAPGIHGVNGFDGPSLAALEKSVVSDQAVSVIIEAARTVDDLWIVATGPLTNVAMAIQEAPDIVSKVNGVSWMGGSAAEGNHTAAAEFNALVDPEAAAIVFEAGLDSLFMAGLDLTHQFVIDDALRSKVAAIGGPGPDAIADLFANYLDLMSAKGGPRSGGLHDPCAVLALTHPELIGRSPRHIVVELDGTHTRGMTLVDQRGPHMSEIPNAEWGHRIDAERAAEVVVESLTSASRRHLDG